MRKKRALARRLVHPTLGMFLLTSAVLLAGCGDDAPQDDATTPGAASDEPEQGPEESGSGEPEIPPGVPFERPAFRIELPKGWVDETDDAMIKPTENEVDARKKDKDGIEHTYAGISDTPDVHYEKIQEDKTLLIESAKNINPKQRFLGMSTFVGEEALHLAGPGPYDGTFRETYEFLHDGDLYNVQVETYGGKRHARALLNRIESTWEWK